MTNEQPEIEEKLRRMVQRVENIRRAFLALIILGTCCAIFLLKQCLGT